MPGGARATGRPVGRPKGTTDPHTALKHAALEKLRTQVRKAMPAMVEAQIANALGIKYLMARQKHGGKFVRLTKDMTDAIQSGQDTEHEMIEVWEKDPSIQAFSDLANRTLDKPAEQVMADLTHGGTVTIKWENE